MTSSSHNEPMGLRFIGQDIDPRNVRLQELADILSATEAMVVSTALRENRDLTKEDIIIGLTSITPGSMVLGFTPTIPQIIVVAFERVADAVQQQAFDLLPADVRDALRRITTFTRKNRCTAEMWTITRNTPLAIIKPDLVIPIATRLEIQTTIYGRVLNAGGRKPNVHLETLAGDIVICRGSEPQIKILAERLYDWVGVAGTAQCDIDTLDIDDFTIETVLPYEDTPITEAMEQLAAIAAPHFAGVDADAYVRALRDDDSEV